MTHDNAYDTIHSIWKGSTANMEATPIDRNKTNDTSRMQQIGLYLFVIVAGGMVQMDYRSKEIYNKEGATIWNLADKQ